MPTASAVLALSPQKSEKSTATARLRSDASVYLSILRDQYLTEEDLAHVVRRDVRTTRRWHALGIGPPRISFNNKLVLYRRESVVEWLNSLERGKPSRRKAR